MTKSSILIKIRWLLILGLALLLLTTFAACQGDLVGPGAQDPDDQPNEEGDRKDSNKEDPGDTGGIALNNHIVQHIYNHS